MPTPNGRCKTMDEYISMFPEDVQITLEKLRAVIIESAAGATETISYGIPTFKLNGNLVHFAAYKKHISLYPTPSAIIAFKKELSPYKQSKGTVQFPIGGPIPFDLIRRIVEFRVNEINNILKIKYHTENSY